MVMGRRQAQDQSGRSTLAPALREDYQRFGSQLRQPQSGPTEPETTMQDDGATNSLQAPQRLASCATVWKWTLSLETFTGEGCSADAPVARALAPLTTPPSTTVRLEIFPLMLKTYSCYIPLKSIAADRR